MSTQKNYVGTGSELPGLFFYFVSENTDVDVSMTDCKQTDDLTQCVAERLHLLTNGSLRKFCEK